MLSIFPYHKFSNMQEKNLQTWNKLCSKTFHSVSFQVKKLIYPYKLNAELN